MRRLSAILVLVSVSFLLQGRTASAADRVTLDSLLDQMVDLTALAEFPDPPFTCKQFSSYDRRSRAPEDHDAWFANGDRNNYLRAEIHNNRKEYVMMDADGPGCIVRIWSANAGGVLRIYVDGNDEPALEMNMQDAMDGKHEPFIAPLAGVHSRGWNLYFPFPYAKHCKVTTTDGALYYHVNYRTYPKGTPVESFSMEKVRAARKKIERVAARLARPYVSNLPPDDAVVRPVKLFRLAPGASKTVAELKGPAAIFELQFALDVGDWRHILRQTVLKITFDGQSEPSVVCPLGDFFGSGPDLNPYESLPLSIHWAGELRSKWFMPFRKSCKITLENRGSKAAGLRAVVTTVPYRWTGRSMYFHAKWRADNRIPTRPFRDWTILECSGRGVFTGCMLSVCNPVKQWWGEGDEKIYVDGEKFPSHFGTGTEDYFGYAWSNTALFSHAYHNQTRCDGPGNYGLTSVNRFHILDRIPFRKSFKFDIEVWHWNPKATVAYNATAYWYARPGGSDFYKPLTKDALEVVLPPPPPKPPKVKGALEGESLKIVKKSGQPEVQGLEGDWSQHKHLWWKGAKVGDVLVLAFPVKEAGRYRVYANFTKANDYGIIQLYINGKKTGKPIDFYNPTVVPTGRMDLGVFDLKKGDNLFKAEIVGKNAKAIPKYMFGLDYLLLKKVK